MTETLAVIPAKATSARVPGKNMRSLGGRPLVEWTIRAALDAYTVTAVYVSTDNPATAVVARQAGARSIGQPRPGMGAQFAVIDTLNALARPTCRCQQPYRPAGVVMLLPTSPFRTAAQIDEAVALWLDHRERCVTSVLDGRAVLRRARWVFADDMQAAGAPYGARLAISNGAIQVAAPRLVLEREGFWPDLPYYMDETTGLDIDTERDWLAAEAIVRGMQREAAA